MSYWSRKKVLVTGGRGFLGSNVVAQLRERGADVFIFGQCDYDLRETIAWYVMTAAKEVCV